MQQIDDLIKWAKAERLNCAGSRLYCAEDSAVYNFIERLLPKLESCKTSPNSQSAPCQHYFYINQGTTVVRCTKCGLLYPFEAQHNKKAQQD